MIALIALLTPAAVAVTYFNYRLAKLSRELDAS